MQNRSTETPSSMATETTTMTTMDDLPDRPLECILLRLGSALCLVRAAAACRRWHRLVAHAGFLARFRSLHPPHVGCYHKAQGARPPAFVPAASSSAALAGVDAHRFSLEYSFPDSESWTLADSRGILLLLYRNAGCGGAPSQCVNGGSKRCGCVYDLVVCDPLARQRQGILWPAPLFHDAAYLLHGEDAGRPIGLSNFRVVVMGQKTDASVFSSGSDGGWRRCGRADVDVGDLEALFYSRNYMGRANGCIYWGVDEGADGGVLVLEETTLELSIAVFPENIWGPYVDKTCRTYAIIGGEDGALRIIRVMNNDLSVFVRHAGASADEWVLEKLLRLSEATMGLPGHLPEFFETEAMMVEANDRFVQESPSEENRVFTVKLETMKVEREHERNKYAEHAEEDWDGDPQAYPYELPWPPALHPDC